MLNRLRCLLFCLITAGLPAQVIEVVSVESGLPLFGDGLLITEDFVVWQRFDFTTIGKLQAKDFGHLSKPTVDIMVYPADTLGLMLTPSHLLWGGGSLGDVAALRLDDIKTDNVRGNFIGVAAEGSPVAATEDYVFLKRDKRLFARSVNDFARMPLDPSELVAELRSVRLTTTHRRVAASDEFFVWQDREPPPPGPIDVTALDSFKIYAKRIDELFTPGAERLIVDTEVITLGSELDLHGSLLVFQRSKTGHSTVRVPPWIEFVDLDTHEEPVVVARAEEGSRAWMDGPSVSEHYVVWIRMNGFFNRSLYGRPLVNAELAGEAFLIEHGGTNATIDGNLVVWHGPDRFVEGVTLHGAVTLAELELPGALDVGDVDHDGQINLTDAVAILQFLFREGWRPRLRLADADDNGSIEIADAMVILRHLFQGEERPGT